MIDLEPRHLELVRALLARHLGEAQVFAFGSRVRGAARRYSDLDLVIRAKGPLDLDRLGELRAAFSESDLPIKVDLLDWAGMDEAFRAQITGNLVSLYP